VNLDLKYAARSLLKIQDAKMTQINRHLGTITQLYRAVSWQLRHISTIGKNLLSSNISSICAHNMVNFGPLAAEIDWRVWGPNKFQRLSHLGFVTAGTSLNKSQPNFA